MKNFPRKITMESILSTVIDARNRVWHMKKKKEKNNRLIDWPLRVKPTFEGRVLSPAYQRFFISFLWPPSSPPFLTILRNIARNADNEKFQENSISRNADINVVNLPKAYRVRKRFSLFSLFEKTFYYKFIGKSFT